MRFTHGCIISLLAVVALVAELILGLIFGVGAGFADVAGSGKAAGSIGFATGWMMIATAGIALLALLCGIVGTLSKKEKAALQWFAGLSVALIILSVVGCVYSGRELTGTPEATRTEPVTVIIEEAEPGLTMNLLEIGHKQSYRVGYGMSYSPGKNYRFVWTRVKVTNESRKTVRVQRDYFRLHSETSYFEPEMFNEPRGYTMFSSAELQPGQTEEGWLVFHILDAPKYTLKFSEEGWPFLEMPKNVQTRDIVIDE